MRKITAQDIEAGRAVTKDGKDYLIRSGKEGSVSEYFFYVSPTTARFCESEYKDEFAESLNEEGYRIKDEN